MDNDFIPVAKPWLGQEEAHAASETIMSGWVTQGAETTAFEDEFTAYTGAKHACAVSSCTTALHLALLAAGVKPGDEVITVSHTFIATANSIVYCGAKPVFVDIQPDTFNIDPSLIEPAISTKTTAILVVHQMGMPVDMTAIMLIAKQYDLPVIEDAACGIGSEIYYNSKWTKIGCPIGDIVCFSFHPRKILTTGDGGMILTNNTEYDQKFRLLRQHGMTVPDTARHNSRQVIFENYSIVGYNYRMTNIQAAVGRIQLKKLDKMIQVRRMQAALYKKLLYDDKELILPHEPDYAHSNWQSFCVRLDEKFDQREFMQFLLDRGIATRRGIMCIHKETPYKDLAAYNLPKSELAQNTGVILPLFHEMTEEQQYRVADTIKKFFCQ